MDVSAYMAESICNIMAKALGWEHTGGCTLYEHRDEVEAMLKARP